MSRNQLYHTNATKYMSGGHPLWPRHSLCCNFSSCPRTENRHAQALWVFSSAMQLVMMANVDPTFVFQWILCMVVKLSYILTDFSNKRLPKQYLLQCQDPWLCLQNWALMIIFNAVLLAVSGLYILLLFRLSQSWSIFHQLNMDISYVYFSPVLIQLPCCLILQFMSSCTVVIFCSCSPVSILLADIFEDLQPHFHWPKYA